MMKKRMKAAAAAAMALAMLGGALPAVPGGAELLNTPLTAHAAGSVTLKNGELTLNGAVTREQILKYRKNDAVESIVAAEDCVLPSDCSMLFYNEGDEAYEVIDDGEGGTISYAYGEPYFWKKLTKIDLSKADTSKVTDMSQMFCFINEYGYDTVFDYTLLGLDHFDTSNVTDMHAMFEGSDFNSLDLSSFDTSNVLDMSYMFSNCIRLASLDLSSFDTSNVTDMNCMFEICPNLTSLDLSSFDTSSCENMNYMFYIPPRFHNNNKLETIYVSDFWSTDAVTNSNKMFDKCNKLKGGDGTVFDENHTDKEYARIDGKDGKPGYLTYKEYEFPGSYVKGVSLALADQIGVTFYVNMKDQVKKAVLSGVPGEVTVTSLNQLLSGDYKGCVKLVYPVNATEARHKITLRLYDKDGKQLRLYNSDRRRAPKDTISFSVQDYIEQAPQYYPDNEKALALADALKNYCNAASNYFCGKDYTVEGIGDVTLASFAGFGVPLHGLKLSLVLNSKTELRVYGINDTDEYIGGTGSLPNLKYDAEGGYHKITGLKPAELVSADDYTINREYVIISPLTYGYYVMKNSSDEALKTVVRALYVYATTARDYSARDYD